VLDVVAGYLLLAEALTAGNAPPAVNFGPAEAELSVTDLLAHWQAATGEPLDWHLSESPPMPEKSRLALNSGLARTQLGWSPRRATAQGVAETANWYQDWATGADMSVATDAAIHAFLKG
jgi:CDP-glucose 4,6-dehydratase